MPYINDDDVIKCDFGALYHGDILVEGDTTETVEIVASSEGSSTQVTNDAPIQVTLIGVPQAREGVFG